MSIADKCPLISFVVPVFGTECYLSRCLDSIGRQNFDRQSIQVVVVDDCSPSDTARGLVERFQKDNPSLSVVFIRHERNSSLFQARRTGVLQSKGEYIFSLDSDDEVDRELCARMYSVATARNLDIVRCRMMEIGPLGERPDVFQDVTCSTRDDLKDKFLEGQIHWPMCGKLIRREVYQRAFARIEKVADRLPYVNSMEDMLQLFPMTFEASSYAAIDYFGYFYHVVPTSLSHGLAHSPKRWAALCDNVFDVRHTLIAVAKDAGLMSNDIDRLERLFFPTIVNVIRNEAQKLPHDERIAAVTSWLKVFDVAKAYKYILDSMGESAWQVFSEGGCFRRRMVRETKHVAVTIPRYFLGGTERVVSRLFEIWRQSFPALRITLVTFTPPLVDDYPLPDGVERVYLDVLVPDYIDKFAELVRNRGIDTVVTANVGSWEGNKLAACAKLQGLRTIGMMHGSFAYFMTYIGDGNLTRSHCFSMYDIVTTVSEFNARVWRELGIPQCRYVRNPLPIRVSEVRRGVPVGKQVLFVGRLSVEKNVEQIIRVFSHVSAKVPDAILQIVGEADPGMEWYREQLESLIRSLGIADRVQMLGYKADVRPYICHASTILLASRYEGAPVVLVEAKQCGVPAVIMDLPYLDLIGEENGCMTVPPGDEGAMAAAVVDIIQNPTRQARLAEAAVRSLTGFSDEDCASVWKGIFRAGLDGIGCKANGFDIDTQIVLSSLNRLCGIFALDKQRERFDAQRQISELREQKFPQTCGNSRAYKIGRTITWPYRMMRSTCRSLRSEGMLATWKRVPRKIRNLKRRFFPSST